MKYKNEIWQSYMKFNDELSVIKYIEDKGDLERLEDRYFFGSMEKDEFYKLYNTFKWLEQYNDKYKDLDSFNKIKKPTNQEIIDAMTYIKVNAKSLEDYANKVKKIDKDLSKRLKLIVKKRIECVKYYTNLADEDFFNKNKKQ